MRVVATFGRWSSERCFSLVALGRTERSENGAFFGVCSCGVFFPMRPGQNREPLSNGPAPTPVQELFAAGATEARPSLSSRTRGGPAGYCQRRWPGGRAELALSPWRSAAILLPIVDRPEGLTVLDVRAADLRSHSPQVAFPGRKIDAGESPREAAVREAEEEIRLRERFFEPLGWLGPCFTGARFRVAPLVALSSRPLH